MAATLPTGTLSGGGLSGTEFGQRLSMQQQEQFHAPPSLYDGKDISNFLLSFTFSDFQTCHKIAQMRNHWKYICTMLLSNAREKRKTRALFRMLRGR